MNYTVLNQTILDTTQNADPIFVSYIPQFVELAERQIYTEVKLPLVQESASITITVGSRTATLPSDHISTRSLSITTSTGTYNLQPKSPTYLDEMYPVTSTEAQPRIYAQENATTLSLAPTPDQAYPCTIKYAGLPASIVTAGTTWLGTNFPHTLLYCALLHAYTFMKGDADIMAYYKAAYDISLTELKNTIAETRQDGFR